MLDRRRRTCQYADCAANGGTGRDDLPVYVRVGPYNVNPETVFQSASVISHEYGHHLGLPDFYNADGVVYGDLNLMASDYSQHMTIFSKQELGWVVPDFLQPGESVDRRRLGGDQGRHRRDPLADARTATPYTLSAANGDQNIHNGQAYGLKLPGGSCIDPARSRPGDAASGGPAGATTSAARRPAATTSTSSCPSSRTVAAGHAGDRRVQVQLGHRVGLRLRLRPDHARTARTTRASRPRTATRPPRPSTRTRSAA